MERLGQLIYLIPAVLIGAVSWGCGDPGVEADRPGSAGATVVRDSAGITVVESAPAVLDGLPTLRLSDEAVTTIGGLDPGPDYAFGFVTFVGRFSNGEIVVGDQDTRRVSLYDSSGVFLRTLAQPGEGPGEIRQSGAMNIFNDSLFLAENGPRRLSVYTAQGFADVTRGHMQSRELRDSPSYSSPALLGFTDRRTAFYRATPPTVRFGSTGAPPPTGETSYPYDLIRLDVDSIVRLPGLAPTEHIVAISESDDRGSIRWQWKPFGSRSFVTLGPQGLVSAQSHSLGFSLLDRDGLVRLVARIAVDPQAVTDADIRAVMDTLVPRLERLEGFGESLVRDLTFGETRELISGLEVGRDGSIWLLQPGLHPIPNEDLPRGLASPEQGPESLLKEWLVFSRDGDPVARVFVPNWLWVQEYDLERGMILVPTDEFGVQTVQVRTLVPTPGEPR